MKTAIKIMLILSLAAFYGCQSSSPRGGSVLKGEGFNIAAPTFTTEIKQGETQNVTLSVQRGAYFKHDVKLEMEAAKGISIEPTKVVVEASESPDVQVRITAPKEAALGVYSVSVIGTPKTGESTSTEFNVKVVSP